MIIPVRCFSCGKPIAHLWPKYQQYLEYDYTPDQALNELGLKKFCCRRMIKTHVELIDKLLEFPTESSQTQSSSPVNTQPETDSPEFSPVPSPTTPQTP